MKIGVLVLAAGNSQRFGSDKRAAVFSPQRTLLEASLVPVIDSGLPLQVCLRPGDDGLAYRLGERAVPCVVCNRAVYGMGATLAQGVAGLPGDWDGVLVALGDMPWIGAGSFLGVARALEHHDIVQARFGGQPGHPVGFCRKLFGELARLDGDRGARGVLERHGADVFGLELEDPGILRDVDSPGDLEGL